MSNVFLTCVSVWIIAFGVSSVLSAKVVDVEINRQDKPFVIFGYSDSEDGDGTISFYQNTFLYSLEVKAWGEIELTEDDRSIKSMPENAYLIIKERNWFTYREIEIRHSPGGLEKLYFVQGRPHDWDDDTQRWLAERLPDIARQTGLGARYRIERIISQRGTAAAIKEISYARSNRAIRIYANVIASQKDLGSEVTQRLISAVAEEMSSSSSLSETLIMIAGKAPQDSSITESLMKAVENISSSSKQSATLITIAERRGLESNSALAMVRTIESISSSSAQSEALSALLRYAPSTDDVWLEYLDAVQAISSSSKQGKMLENLIEKKPGGYRVWRKMLKVIEGVSSSSAQGDVLEAFAAACPTDEDIMMDFIRTVGYISSSSQQGRVLMALLEKNGLSSRVLEAVIEFANAEISSSSVAKRVTDRATRALLKK